MVSISRNIYEVDLIKFVDIVVRDDAEWVIEI